MKSLLEMTEEVTEREDCLEKIKQGLQGLVSKKMQLLADQSSVEGDLYQKKVYLAHIKEIYRLAKTQFSRLRGLLEPTLTEADVRELDKWVGRARGEDGLRDIINALLELDKYKTKDIKTCLYALVQKIIIGGAYNQRAKP